MRFAVPWLVGLLLLAGCLSADSDSTQGGLIPLLPAMTSSTQAPAPVPEGNLAPQPRLSVQEQGPYRVGDNLTIVISAEDPDQDPWGWQLDVDGDQKADASGDMSNPSMRFQASKAGALTLTLQVYDAYQSNYVQLDLQIQEADA